MINNSTMSIVVVSCDSYRDILEMYLYYLRLNWNDCPYSIYLGMEKMEIEDGRSKSVLCGENSTWTKRAIECIKQSESKFILLSVDDLFISEKVDNNDLEQILDFMSKESIKYYRIPVFKFKHKKIVYYPGNNNAELIPSNQRYNVSIGTAIWDRDELLNILGDGTMSAWDLENYFLEKSEIARPGYLEKYVSDRRFVLHSVHMIKSGKWIPSSVKRMKELGYAIEYKKRGYISFRDRIKLNRFYSFCSRKLPKWIRNPIKKMLSFFGFKFASK